MAFNARFVAFPGFLVITVKLTPLFDSISILKNLFSSSEVLFSHHIMSIVYSVISNPISTAAFNSIFVTSSSTLMFLPGTLNDVMKATNVIII